nr:transposon Ty3-I Gag-Pol polyprotein [Tanacetum cinerariifolium]
MYLAAAKEAISAVLMKEKDMNQMPIYFVSQALQGTKVNYTPMEKLILALTKTSVKGQILADFIVERLDDENQDTLMDDNEELLEPRDNEAEYEALIAGLRIAMQMGVENLQANVDSKLVANQANYVLRENHEGSCSIHFGPRSMVAKALRSGYYWPTMHTDDRNLIRECSNCQAHCTMIKSSNGETPFSLTYEAEVVIPLEIGMPTLRTTKVDMIKNDEALRVNLDLLEEKREHVAIQEARSKAKMEKYYNATIRSTSFRLGDLVYRKTEESSNQSERDRMNSRKHWGKELETTTEIPFHEHGASATLRNVIHMKCKHLSHARQSSGEGTA